MVEGDEKKSNKYLWINFIIIILILFQLLISIILLINYEKNSKNPNYVDRCQTNLINLQKELILQKLLCSKKPFDISPNPVFLRNKSLIFLKIENLNNKSLNIFEGNLLINKSFFVKYEDGSSVNKNYYVKLFGPGFKLMPHEKRVVPYLLETNLMPGTYILTFNSNKIFKSNNTYNNYTLTLVVR